MYKIHGLSISSNTTKTVYVAEALGIDYDYIALDVMQGENKTPEHFQRHPLGKLPTLTHDNNTLFESNAICCYLADMEDSPLYPVDDKFQRAKIHQWLAFFTNHLGHWFNNYTFEKVAKITLGIGEPNERTIKKAEGFIQEQLPCVNTHLKQHCYFLGDQLSIADYVAFAYFETAELGGISLNDFQATADWYETLKDSEAVRRARQRLQKN